MIKNFILPCFCTFILFSCQPAPEQKYTEEKREKKVEIEKKNTSKIEKKAAFVRLTDENAVQELTKFAAENPETELLIETSLGNIYVKLYTETPLHRANFIRLVKLGYFDQTIFYRVIAGFMAQGGNSDNAMHTAKRFEYGNYTLPPEFRKNLIHKKGALSMSREYENNPKKHSAPYDFFLVQGELISAPGSNYSKEQKEVYNTLGGAPHLDNEHTVFGEITRGLDVLDKICAAQVDEVNWPLTDISIKVKIIR